MEEVLSNPAATELRVKQTLRDMLMEEIHRQHLTTDDLARKLDLLPAGAQVLMERQEWSIQVSLRVAEILGIEVDVQVKPKR